MMRLTILFTRLPIRGETKSRLRDFLDLDQILHLTKYLIDSNYRVLIESGYDCQVWYTSEDPEASYRDYFSNDDVRFYRQIEGDLGQKMYHAIQQAFNEGYEQVLLVGSDLYNLSQQLVEEAFMALGQADVVISQTFDGGYGLIAMNRPIKEVFDLPAYGNDLVFERLIHQAKLHQVEVTTVGQLIDIDTKDDIAKVLSGDTLAHFLAQGEYNANFIFDNGRQLLRIALGSQMNLPDQIDYEYKTLKCLESSGVVPKVYELVPSTQLIGLGYLTEEFLPGRSLIYETDYKLAAQLLAAVHRVNPETCDHLIQANQPFQVMYDEFISMFSVYQAWSERDLEIEHRIQALLKRLFVFNFEAPLESACIINTELNSGNFLINETGPSYIIDWEKPLLGEREQDLGHFLAPTTTLWKTDFVFDEKRLETFIQTYNQNSPIPVNVGKLNQYLIFTCLRGLTWCSMAYVQYYQEDKVLTNDDTFKVIKRYMTADFLTMIENYVDQRMKSFM